MTSYEDGEEMGKDAKVRSGFNLLKLNGCQWEACKIGMELRALVRVINRGQSVLNGIDFDVYSRVENYTYLG